MKLSVISYQISDICFEASLDASRGGPGAKFAVLEAGSMVLVDIFRGAPEHKKRRKIHEKRVSLAPEASPEGFWGLWETPGARLGFWEPLGASRWALPGPPMAPLECARTRKKHVKYTKNYFF